MIRFGVIGSGSWGTALAKVLTDKGHHINWWIRTDPAIDYLNTHHHNAHYLRSVKFDMNLIHATSDINKVAKESDVLVFAVPSSYAESVLSKLQPDELVDKKIISAIKGLLPVHNVLLNQYLNDTLQFPLENYFAVLGPCHAEEVAEEKLSYLTISGVDVIAASSIASHFSNSYINTIVNPDIMGVQYAAVLKNIYALGAGIAHGLDYGDNFLSVYIANAADEMASFLKKFGAEHITVGEHDEEDPVTHRKSPNYAASVYLGDLLVTCYSLHSRNRTFGNMIGKGYSAKAAQLELNMHAEGYNAAKCIYDINKQIGSSIPIAENIYRILWENLSPADGFSRIEQVLV